MVPEEYRRMPVLGLNNFFVSQNSEFFLAPSTHLVDLPVSCYLQFYIVSFIYQPLDLLWQVKSTTLLEQLNSESSLQHSFL